MSLDTLPAPAAPSTPGTFALDDTVTVQYTVAPTITSGVGLNMKIAWPVLTDATIPRPLVIFVSNQDWTTTVETEYDTEAETCVCELGCIAATIETRVQGDDPLSAMDEESHTVLRRSIRAAVYDLDTAVKYILENYLETADFSIEPGHIFIAGFDAGGVTAILYPHFFPSRPIAGLITVGAALGYDTAGTTPDTATEIIQQQLYQYIRQHRTPTCAFTTGNDTAIGTTTMGEYQTQNGLITSSVVHHDASSAATDGHPTFTTFDTAELTAASTLAEAFYNFISARCSVARPVALVRQNRRLYKYYWPKLQSRYWS